jgi:hypothetical protein
LKRWNPAENSLADAKKIIIKYWLESDIFLSARRRVKQLEKVKHMKYAYL